MQVQIAIKKILTAELLETLAVCGGRGLVCAGRRVGHLPRTSVTEDKQAGEGSEVELSGVVLTGDLQLFVCLDDQR